MVATDVKTVYVSHPYNGEEANKREVEAMMRNLVKLHPGVVFISPIHTFGFMYNDVPYKEGMDWCIELLNRCDEILLCGSWEDSRGCRIEWSHSLQHKIPVKYEEDYGLQIDVWHNARG